MRKVIELDRPVTTSYEKLVLVSLGPGKVVLGIVCIEAMRIVLVEVTPKTHIALSWSVQVVPSHIRLLDLDALRSQSQAIQASVPYYAVVGRRGDCDARVEVGGVFNSVWIEPLCAEL